MFKGTKGTLCSSLAEFMDFSRVGLGYSGGRQFGLAWPIHSGVHPILYGRFFESMSSGFGHVAKSAGSACSKMSPPSGRVKGFSFFQGWTEPPF